MVSGKLNQVKKVAASLAGSGTVAELLPTSNREVGATSIGVKLEKKYKVQHKFVRNRQNEGMDVMMKALIEESTKERKFPGPIGVGANCEK